MRRIWIALLFISVFTACVKDENQLSDNFTDIIFCKPDSVFCPVNRVNELFADGQSMIRIRAKFDRTTYADESVTFSTSSGSLLLLPVSGNEVDTNRLTFKPKSSDAFVFLKAGTRVDSEVIITVQVADHIDYKTLRMLRACAEEVIFAKPDITILANNTVADSVTFQLLRAVGQVSDGARVSFTAVNSQADTTITNDTTFTTIVTPRTIVDTLAITLVSVDTTVSPPDSLFSVTTVSTIEEDTATQIEVFSDTVITGAAIRVEPNWVLSANGAATTSIKAINSVTGKATLTVTVQNPDCVIPLKADFEVIIE